MRIQTRQAMLIALLAVGLSGCETVHRWIVEWGRDNSSTEEQCRQGGCPPQTPAAAAPGPRLDVRQTGDTAEYQTLVMWMDSAQATLGSDRFRTNLASLAADYPTVYFREGYPAGAIPVTGTVAYLQTLLDATPSTWYIPSTVSLVGGPTDDTAVAAWQTSTIALGRVFLGRWKSSNAVEKSCAINTAVHEISHTLSIYRDTYIYVLTDNDRRRQPPQVPAASYLVGSVAQCTWLQESGRIASTTSALRACVAVFGSRHFNNLRCDRFDATEPVVEHAGLPAARTDAD